MIEAIILTAVGWACGFVIGRITESKDHAKHYLRGYEDARKLYKFHMNATYGPLVRLPSPKVK